MDIQDFDFLISQEGQKYLKEIGTDPIEPSKELALIKKLRKNLSLSQTGALIDTVKMRYKALQKFPKIMAQNLYFTSEALQQATRWELSEKRAEIIHKRAPLGLILDLGCGIGSDSLALSMYRKTVAYDLDPLRLRILKENAQILQKLILENKDQFKKEYWDNHLDELEVFQEDYTLAKLPLCAAMFCDPARRKDGKRLQKPEDTEPSFSAILKLTSHCPNLAVKMAPSIPRDLLSSYGIDNWSLEFWGTQTDCREALVLLGSLSEKSEGTEIKAAVLDKNKVWHHLSACQSKAPLGELKEGQFLYEACPTCIRSGAIYELAHLLKSHLFDEDVAWLVSDEIGKDGLDSPWSCRFLISEIHHFSLKELQKRISQLNIGQGEIKKRNFAMEPDELRKKLKFCNSKNNIVIMLTRVNGKPCFMLGHRQTAYKYDQ